MPIWALLINDNYSNILPLESKLVSVGYCIILRPGLSCLLLEYLRESFWEKYHYLLWTNMLGLIESNEIYKKINKF